MTVQPAPKQFFPGLQRSASAALAPFQREFNRMIDELASSWTNFTDFELTPSMDVRETPTAVEISMEVPGMDLSDIKVELEDNVLTVRGEKKSEKEVEEKDRRVSERMYGAFARSITLPSSVQADKIQASMDKGVLSITAPKDGEAKTRTIEVRSAK